MSTQLFRPTVGSAHADEGADANSDTRTFNTLALAGMAFGLLSIRYPALGVMPVMGIVFSTLGIVTFDASKEKMRWLAGFGMALSMVPILLRLSGH